MMPSFANYIGIDYSGAQTPTASLNGLRIYPAERNSSPAEVSPPPSPRKYWTRRGIAEWLVERVHFWPFDGWDIPARCSAMVEVYPALWNRGCTREDRNGDQHDAYSVAAWLRRSDLDGGLAAFFKPALTPPERTMAQVEGWILGVMSGLANAIIDIVGLPELRTLAWLVSVIGLIPIFLRLL